MSYTSMPLPQGLYHPVHEHDSCGVGFTANIDGTPTHEVVRNGIEILINLMHRGAIGGDQSTGDGAGILIQIPHEFFAKACPPLDISLPDAGKYAVGMVFMPRDGAVRERCMAQVKKNCEDEGLAFLGWREVPVNESAISGQAFESRPVIMQFFADGKGMPAASCGIRSCG